VVILISLVTGACSTKVNVTASPTTRTSNTTRTTASSTATTTTTSIEATTTTLSTTTTAAQSAPLPTTPSLPMPTQIFYNSGYPEACIAGQELPEQINVYVFPNPNRSGAPLSPPITGTVTFSGPLSGTASVDLLNGRASLGGACPNAVGTVTETFSYSGDANWAPSNASGPYEILKQGGGT